MPLFHLFFLYLLFFLSGAASLLYQVMWMKELSLLFGGSTQSAAVTTAAFFLGLGLGAHYIGSKVKSGSVSSEQQLPRFMSVYAGLEIAIAVSALCYFLIYPVFNGVYSTLFSWLQNSITLLVIMKSMIAILLLSVPAFFMGGTLPVMAELVVKNDKQFASGVAGIYFINTLGACAGAIAGGFWLPRVVGFDVTYAIAISISVGLAILAFAYRIYLAKLTTKTEWANSFQAHPDKAQALNTQALNKQVTQTQQKLANAKQKAGNGNTQKAIRQTKAAKIPGTVLLISAWSGFASLALQVLWTRLFSQVLQNSTYTYSAILAVFLLALTLGALLAKRLASYQNSRYVLAIVMLTSGVLIALTPFSFMQLTNDMSYIGGRVELVPYISEVMGVIATVIGLPVLVMGICLPYLYKWVEQQVGAQYAHFVGRINGINTFAAILGSLLAGFVLFRWLGTWHAIYAIALCYMLLAVLLFSQAADSSATSNKAKQNFRGGVNLALLATAAVILLLNPSKLPIVPIDPIKKKERLLQVWEGSMGTVAVVERDGNRKTKLNNWYALGGSKAKQMEAMQTHLPVNLHGQPKAVFYLGLGTGITAGTVLNYPTQKVVVAELVKEVITASKDYFGEFNQGLFDDPRVTVVNEDGRHYLAASQETFDLVIADLFIPWRAGVGNTYALEHYQTALKRLNKGGLYVQWLPMYQLSEKEFDVIAATMLEAFPMVTVWRGDFFSSKPVMALIGHESSARMSEQTLFRQVSRKTLQNRDGEGQIPLLSHYVGQLTADLDFIQQAQINTDANPVIEYQAPISHRAEKSGRIEWLTGASLLSLMRQIQNPQDSFLIGMSEQEMRAIFAGYFLQASRVAKELKDKRAEDQARAQFQQLLND